ncbi:hypothetical protein PC9H_003557 [Pleurotus ostreatus]|uniref:Uncharacterized protein n=1 Tax=Pleurotus ostreatus TaxID=5322 RepID=A0A8H7A1P1_PLEOS|nr:uncharacterized protein PC9H_003557 [Pleurotus ostreatus]KAF7436724.1 hypothetical protein PC9H_003557 [Pleurotus ostreatus]
MHNVAALLIQSHLVTSLSLLIIRTLLATAVMSTSTEDVSERTRAARTIQHAWRRRNEATAKYMTANNRWIQAVGHAELEFTFEELQVDNSFADQGQNTPKARWRRASDLIKKLRDPNERLQLPGQSEPTAALKQLETQHWLELIDGKWVEEDTQDNFFKWLDKGAGKDLSLKECPRSQLEAERIQYLSDEQRLNYLVEIDQEGKLRWARNHQFVDTSAGHWKEAGEGLGIVADELPGGVVPTTRRDSGSSSVQSSDPQHYAEPIAGKYRITRLFRKYFTIRGVLNRLLRKTVRRNTWIYVSDKNFNIFIGIKETGEFQHSSFLGGGLVTSAGLISVKDGLIHTLSPLSGHYRTSTEHFHQFLEILEKRGVNLHKAKISKAEAALWGIEHITKLKKSGGQLLQGGKDKAKEIAIEGREALHLPSPSDHHGWKQDILRGRIKPPPSEKQQNLHSS